MTGLHEGGSNAWDAGRTFLRRPSCAMFRAVLLASSLIAFDSLPPMPVLALLSALFRVSLALTSTGMKPNSLQS